MIDNWFKTDLKKIYKQHDIVVFIDESYQANFLTTNLEEVKIIETSNEIEELEAKYNIEKNKDQDLKFLIYTNTPKDKLKFIREYCETNGSVEIKYFEHYIKQKVNQYLNLNINLPKEELISAAKVSVGKGKTYWMDLSHKGSSEIFDLEKELLPFLHNPNEFTQKYDEETTKLFFKKVADLINQTYIQKPAKTIAADVANEILNSLYNNKIHPTLLSVYTTWLDSFSYKSSFEEYLSNYKKKKKADVFNIHPAHPFKQIDKKWLEEIGKVILDKKTLANLLPKINQRNANRTAKNLDVTFWKYVKALIEFDEKNINQISSLDEAISFYKNHFYKLDQAIRKLYTEFLNEENVIEPFQVYYKNLVTIFLDKWFNYINDYKSSQTGLIQKILDENTSKTAIVVGDGVAWEFATEITEGLRKYGYDLSKNHILAGLPSETEHNMSQLYLSSGEVVSTKQKREKYLKDNNTEKQINFIDLENINESTDFSQYMICSYKDPDKLGETYQQKALKYFDQVAETYIQKINQLLQNGYQNVYLVTDHGYTLTGVLENSDKIEINFNGHVNKNERYIRTTDSQDINSQLIHEYPAEYESYNYCYFAKRLGPFKTPGVYGFSHGGISPQETIIPYLRWSNKNNNKDYLDVTIENKDDLTDVTGNLYSIKLKASIKSSNLFTHERKVMLLFFSGGKKVNESDIITIKKDETIKKEYHFGEYKNIEVKMLDAISKEQLDKVSISQNQSRDLGGLM